MCLVASAGLLWHRSRSLIIPEISQLGSVGIRANGSQERERSVAPPGSSLGNAIRTHLATGGQHLPSSFKDQLSQKQHFLVNCVGKVEGLMGAYWTLGWLLCPKILFTSTLPLAALSALKYNL